MRTTFFLALAILAIVSVAMVEADKHKGDKPPPPPPLLAILGKIYKIIKDDPINEKISAQMKEWAEISLEARKRLRKKLAAYLNQLEKET